MKKSSQSLRISIARAMRRSCFAGIPRWASLRESSGETEAGTTQRDLVRQDVATITVSFSVSKRWLEKLSGFRNLPRLTVKYFSPDTLQYKSAQMYIDGFKAKLEHDTSYKSLWTVNFTLHEF